MLLSYQCLVRIRLGHICLYQKCRGFWYCALASACYDNEEMCMGSPKLLPERVFDHWRKRSNVETAFSIIKAKFGGPARTKTPVVRGNEVLFQLGGDSWIPEPARRKRAKGKGRGGLTAQPRPQANRRLNPRWHISIIMETVLGRNHRRMPTRATPLVTPAGGSPHHPGTVPQRSQEAFTTTAGGPREPRSHGKGLLSWAKRTTADSWPSGPTICSPAGGRSPSTWPMPLPWNGSDSPVPRTPPVPASATGGGLPTCGKCPLSCDPLTPRGCLLNPGTRAPPLYILKNSRDLGEDMIAGIYVRTSTVRQGEGRNLPANPRGASPAEGN